MREYSTCLAKAQCRDIGIKGWRAGYLYHAQVTSLVEFCWYRSSHGGAEGDGDLVCTSLSVAGQTIVNGGIDVDSRTRSVFIGCFPFSLWTEDLVPVPKESMGLSAVPDTDSHRDVRLWSWCRRCREYQARWRLLLDIPRLGERTFHSLFFFFTSERSSQSVSLTHYPSKSKAEGKTHACEKAGVGELPP